MNGVTVIGSAALGAALILASLHFLVWCRDRQARVSLVLVLLITLGGLAKGQSPRVLILFSNDRLLPANQRLEEGIRRALDPRDDQAVVTVFGEFLDAIRFGGAEREAAMDDYLRSRYRDLPPRVLVALGPQALEFFLARRDSLFPGTPLLFGGVSAARLGEFQGQPGVAGLPMELTVAPAVEALLAMRPQTREVLLVHGSSEFDRDWRDTALRQCAPFAGRVKVAAFSELPLDELKTRLGELGGDKALLYLSYFQSPAGETYTPARVAAEIATAAAVPVMSPYDTYVGTGVLGVSASPFEEEGVVLGGLIRRVLDGETPEAIGILPPNPSRLIFDARQVKRWGIKQVPAGAELRFRTPTLWKQHRTGVIITVAVFCLQGLLITGLVFTRLRQKRAEKKLRLSEARFSGVFRGSPSALCIVRQSDGRIVDANPGWEAATGVPRAQAIGRTPLETGLVIPGDAEGRFRLFLEAGKALKDFEQLHRAPDGRERLLSLTTELITLHEEPCYIIVAEDVTGLREMEDARQNLAHTSRLAMLGEMTASIAHEVNQPLGAILSNAEAAEMLLEHPAPPLGEVKQILSDIRRDDLRASSVIKRVRAMVGRREVELVAVDLNELLRGTIKLVTHDAQRRGVSVMEEFAADLPPVHADPVQVEQVVLNLLLNAMDAMKDTPVAERRIVVRSARRNGDAVQASVEDRGHGIPPEKQGRLFDSFFTTKEGGMGLGLALARSIAEAHGGYLFAENNTSTGAVFHLILPVNFPSAHVGHLPGDSDRPSDR
jgi:PAS domain S-box-containing protein